MIRTEQIIVNKTPEEIKSLIGWDISDGPEFGFNFFTKDDLLTQRKREINETKPFIGEINGNTIMIAAKGLKYWPRTKISLQALPDGKTKLKITYKYFFIYLITYIFLLTIAYSDIFKEEKKIKEIISNSYPFIIIFILLPLFARWLQINLKNYFVKL